MRQWHRCIALSSEPWIWLFSDDDIADPECVEAFYHELQETDGYYNVYRFNSLTIDEQDKVIRINPPHPKVENPMLFAYDRLTNSHRSSFAQDHIFPRRVYKKCGGFIDLPAAWYSDDATWIEFAGDKDIYTISGPYVRWRLSSINVSAANLATRHLKMQACLLYLKWLKIKYEDEKVEKLLFDGKLLIEHSRAWLHNNFLYATGDRIIINMFTLAKQMNEIYEDGIGKNIRLLLGINKRILFNNYRNYRRAIRRQWGL